MTTSTPERLAISTRGLRKTYRTRHGRQVAVDSLDLNVPLGGVHGFLGPNGSGKTTTLRMLLGLIRSDAGSMEILGHQIPAQLPEVIGDIGAIVEQPRFFGPFSGRLNLELVADAIGVQRDQVGRVLEEVGLAGRAKDPFQTYSLGMKQRLAVSATLLKDPQIVIFDEPTNGLDPAGIHEIRETMRALGEQGRTVLVSSHILSEIEQVADTVSIISRGRLIAEGAMAELTGGAGTLVRVGLPQLGQAQRVLIAGGLQVRPEGQTLLVSGAQDAGQVARLLGEAGLWVHHLSSAQRDLETVFLELTGDQPNALSHSGGSREAPATFLADGSVTARRGSDPEATTTPGPITGTDQEEGR